MDADGPEHHPVLYQEIIHALSPRREGYYVDGTVGAGGHAFGILQASAPDGHLLGLDRDPNALELARHRLEVFGERVILVHASFTDLDIQIARLGWPRLQGILLDLGVSSMQLDEAERGFSFQREGPLDMRFDPDAPVRAADLVNGLPESELADLLYRFGEERLSRRLARAIVQARPLRTTLQLAEVIHRAAGGRRGRLHPATRTFQALRIAVNDELTALDTVLPVSVSALAPGGRLAVIAFHSLEDRRVKEFFRQESEDCVCPPGQPICTCEHQATLRLVTRKPIQPGPEEVFQNPRARSARLRVAEKMTG